MRSRFARLRLCLLALSLFAPIASVRAQESLITNLLTRAKTALNDLKYTQADSLARLVIGLGDLVPRDQRVTALQIAAGARYPEEAQFQKPDSAMSALRAVVALGHNAPIPFDISWPGLDSMYVRAGGALTASAVPAGSPGAGSASGGPTLEETAQWLNERLPQFTGLTWKDSGEVAVSTASESIDGFNVTGCTMKYRVQHRAEDYLLRDRKRTNVVKADTAFTFDVRRLEGATLQLGTMELAARLFPNEADRLGSKQQVGYLRVAERGSDPKVRRVDLSFTSGAQARRVRTAMDRLIQLCAKEPF